MRHVCSLEQISNILNKLLIRYPLGSALEFCYSTFKKNIQVQTMSILRFYGKIYPK